MRFYRVYVIDTADNIADTSFIQALGDKDVMAIARAKLGQDAALEIWDQRQLVARMSPRDEAAFPFTFMAADEMSLAT